MFHKVLKWVIPCEIIDRSYLGVYSPGIEHREKTCENIHFLNWKLDTMSCVFLLWHGGKVKLNINNGCQLLDF